jgi:hypothetical protein
MIPVYVSICLFPKQKYNFQRREGKKECTDFLWAGTMLDEGVGIYLLVFRHAERVQAPGWKTYYRLLSLII